MMRFFKLLSVIILLLCGMSAAHGEAPVTTDSRIKIFVYNENEVYHLTIHHGYQSSIEFGPGEEVETISLGDTYAWKITPVGRRLFIKPLEANVRTNMTIITSKRTYQFDVVSKVPDGKLDEELVYVARFYYPDKPLDMTNPAMSESAPAPMPLQAYGAKQGAPVPPPPSPGMSQQGTMEPMPSYKDSMNGMNNSK